MDFILIISILISLGASILVRSRYSKYKKIKNSKGETGFDVAREILDRNGLKDVLILETKGELTDHFDPTKGVIKLSTDIYNGTSIASISVAAHECGHAIQKKVGYSFYNLRASIFPVVRISSILGYIAIMIGLLFQALDLLYIGILFEIVILLFQLVTLPVEFDASNRAKEEIAKLGYSTDELEGINNMLLSAALTYVASVITTLLEIFRLLLIARNNRR